VLYPNNVYICLGRGQLKQKIISRPERNPGNYYPGRLAVIDNISSYVTTKFQLYLHDIRYTCILQMKYEDIHSYIVESLDLRSIYFKSPVEQLRDSAGRVGHGPRFLRSDRPSGVAMGGFSANSIPSTWQTFLSYQIWYFNMTPDFDSTFGERS
jgi:hypothetical protein